MVVVITNRSGWLLELLTELKNTLYDHDDTEIPYSSRLDANLCKSVSIGTAGRFIPTSGGANSQKKYSPLFTFTVFVPQDYMRER